MNDSGRTIKRFSAYRVVEHLLNALVFTVLVLTGLSQKFHEYRVSEWIILQFGGIDSARLIHRFSGFAFTVLCMVHVATAAAGVLLKKFPPSMVITLNDFRDAVQNIRYYLGLTNHPARCDRYDYKQKFEYWGVIAGGMLMIVTGVILWFPVAATALLPGEAVPAAKAAHTNEAFLAFLVIIIWHVYNAIFSPEVFPLDRSIFTGSISRERMVHEHPLELSRIERKPVEEILALHEDGTYAVSEHE